MRRKIILVIGGTGSIGNALLKSLLKTDIKEIRILSRDEHKQHKMKRKYNDDRITYFLGDIINTNDIEKCIYNVDTCINLAALKHVGSGEADPVKITDINIKGHNNVVQVCLKNKVYMIYMSTDKSVNPVNVYGMTKHIAEKITLKAGYTVIRSGNVIGSRGSILPIFCQQKQEGKTLILAHENMERYFISKKDIANIIIEVIEKKFKKVVIVPVMESVKILDIIKNMKAIYKVSDSYKNEKLKELLVWDYEKIILQTEYYVIVGGLID